MIIFDRIKTWKCFKTHLQYFHKEYGLGATIEQITSQDNPEEHIFLLFFSFEDARTPEMAEYYLSLNPPIYNVRQLIRWYECFQTPELLSHFMSLNPTQADIDYLTHTLYDNPEMLKILGKK